MKLRVWGVVGSLVIGAGLSTPALAAEPGQPSNYPWPTAGTSAGGSPSAAWTASFGAMSCWYMGNCPGAQKQAPPPPEPVQPAPSTGNIEKLSITGLEELVLSKINSERAGKGLGELRPNPWAQGVARAHAQAMVAKGELWHNSDYLAKGKAAMNATSVSENVARDYSVAAAHLALMNSPGHRVNILKPAFTHVGVGVAIAGQTVYIAQDFANIAGAAPMPNVKTAPAAAVVKAQAAPKPAAPAADAPNPTMEKTEVTRNPVKVLKATQIASRGPTPLAWAFVAALLVALAGCAGLVGKKQGFLTSA